MNSRRHVVELVLAVIGIIGLATSVEAENSENARHRLPGSWHAQAGTAAQGTFPGLFTFTSDGGVIGTESPGPFESPAIGSWVARGGGAAFTFFALFGSPAGGGQNTGRLKVVGSLHFDHAADGWSGPFKIDVFDAAGHLLFTDRGQITLTRIVVESID